MEKKKHKWKYKVNVKKKVLVLIILGVLVFVGIGFSILESNLGLGGTIEVSKYDKTLYGVMQKEVNKGYALKYTGSHQDSMDSTKSTEDIYHFYAASNDTAKGDAIRNSNNVVFAGYCWQIMRTTDTGGVKLLYNGEPDEIIVDGETRLNCGDTRPSYRTDAFQKEIELGGVLLYAKNYAITKVAGGKTFTLVDDPDDPDDYKYINITSSNATEQIADIAANYPYTCASTVNKCSSTRFYTVIGQSSGTKANVTGTISTDSIGDSPYNNSHNLPAYAGYMYGDTFGVNSFRGLIENFAPQQSQTVLNSSSAAFSSYKFSLAVSPTASGFELVNPIAASDVPDDDYSGYYSCGTLNTCTNALYYIAKKDGTSAYYYVRLSPGQTLSDLSIMIGDTLEDNGDNTYTIKNGQNQATEVTPVDWYSDYANYVGKYTCGDANDTCQNPRYIVATTISSYTYLQDLQNKMVVAKTKNGLDISDDYVIINKVDWYNGYNTTYADYAYTCGNTDTLCTESNLRYIVARTANNYTYTPNYYFGSSVIYENNVYKLQNTITLENIMNTTELATHHYVCLNAGEKECANVGYIYYVSNYWLFFIILDNPSITSVGSALNEMLANNKNDSAIKKFIDDWYEANIKDTIYESKLDDTIYCNDRSFSTSNSYNITFADSGWNDNGTTFRFLYFNGVHNSNGRGTLICNNLTDRFSLTNSSAKLKYPIGLMSSYEINLLYQKQISKPLGNGYWVLGPGTFGSAMVGNFYVTDTGSVGNGCGNGECGVDVTNVYSVRPTISLIAGTKYSSGNGEMTNPYIVDMSN